MGLGQLRGRSEVGWNQENILPPAPYSYPPYGPLPSPYGLYSPSVQQGCWSRAALPSPPPPPLYLTTVGPPRCRAAGVMLPGASALSQQLV